jgi:hypothetical protein
VRKATVYNILFVLLVTAVSAAGGAWGVKQRPPVWRAEKSFFVVVRPNKITPEFQFDAYYATQTAAAFGEMLAAWFNISAVTAAAFRHAGLTPPPRPLNPFSRALEAKKLAAQLVEVRVRAGGEKEARKLLEAVTRLAENRVRVYNQQGDPRIHVSLIGSDTIVMQEQFSSLLGALAGGGVGFLVALNLVVWWSSSGAGEESRKKES